MVANYLSRRLGLGREQARKLEPLAFRAVEGYLRSLGALPEEGIDAIDVRLRLEAPYVFGLFAAEVASDPGIRPEVKARAMREAYSSIDLARPPGEAFPAFLLSVLRWIPTAEGINMEAVEMAMIAFDTQREVLVSSSPSEAIELMEAVFCSEDVGEREMTILLGILLSLETTSASVAEAAVRAYLSSRRVSPREKRRLVAALLDDGYGRRFWSDRHPADLMGSHVVSPLPSQAEAARGAAVVWRFADVEEAERAASAYMCVPGRRLLAPDRLVAALRILSSYPGATGRPIAADAASLASGHEDPRVSSLVGCLTGADQARTGPEGPSGGGGAIE